MVVVWCGVAYDNIYRWAEQADWTATTAAFSHGRGGGDRGLVRVS